MLRSLYDFSRIFQQDVLLEELMKVRFHPMKSTKSSLVLLSKKSTICDKLVNASNLKPLHGLSLKLSEFQFYFQDLTVFFILHVCSIW